MDEILEFLKVRGIKDYDDLTQEEQGSYREMLNVVQSSQVTLEDVKKHVKAMRYSVELEIAKALPTDPRLPMLQGRLMNYILFESLFDRPERAKDMLEQYGKRQGR